MSIKGSPYTMELDTGSSRSLISLETLKRLCPGWGLKPPDYVLVDFQQNPVPMLGVGKFQVKNQQFDGLLELLVVEGHRISLLGLTQFTPLGIKVTGVHQSEWWDFSSICNELLSVFDGTIGRYTGPPVSLLLDPQVRPLRLKARCVPFSLKPNIDEELECLVVLGSLKTVPHAAWEMPIVTTVKPNGDVSICADCKCTINKALQDHTYPILVVSHVLATLAGAKVFSELEFAQADQQLPVDDATC